MNPTGDIDLVGFDCCDIFFFFDFRWWKAGSFDCCR